MRYEINVSLNGKHFFATAERSLTTKEDAMKVLVAIIKKFPKSDGFKVDISEWREEGTQFTDEEFLSANLFRGGR